MARITFRPELPAVMIINNAEIKSYDLNQKINNILRIKTWEY